MKKASAAIQPTATTIKLPPRHAQIHAMLCWAQGATVAEIAAELGLLHHSVRGMISTGRSKYGWDVLKGKNADGHTVYSLLGTAADAKPAKAAPKARQTSKAAKPAAAARKAKTAKSRKATAVQADTAAEARMARVDAGAGQQCPALRRLGT